MSRLLWKIFYFYKRSVCLCLSNSLYQIKQSPSFHFSSTKFGLYSVQIHISWELLKVSGLKWFVQCWANKNTVSLDKKKKTELRLPLQMSMKWKVSRICIFLLCNIWMIGCYETLLGRSLKINHVGWLWESSRSFDSVFSLIVSPWFLIFLSDSLFRPTSTHRLYPQRTQCSMEDGLESVWYRNTYES